MVAKGRRPHSDYIALGTTVWLAPATGVEHAHRDFEASLPKQSAHLTFARGRRIWTLGRGGALDLAIAAIHQDQHYLSSAITAWVRLHFLTHVAAGTDALRRAGLDAPLRLKDVPAASVGELADWARAEAVSLADASERVLAGSASGSASSPTSSARCRRAHWTSGLPYRGRSTSSALLWARRTEPRLLMRRRMPLPVA